MTVDIHRQRVLDEITNHKWVAPDPTRPIKGGRYHAYEFTWAEVRARAVELFPFWRDRLVNNVNTFEEGEERWISNQIAGARYANSMGTLFESALMTLALEQKYLAEDKLELVKWRRRCDNFFNPAGGAGWAKR